MGFSHRATPPGVAGTRYKQKDRVPTTTVIARSEATWQSVLFPAPFGAGRYFAPQGMRIAPQAFPSVATGFALTMTVRGRPVPLRPGAAIFRVPSAERHGGRSLQEEAISMKRGGRPQADRPTVTEARITIKCVALFFTKCYNVGYYG